MLGAMLVDKQNAPHTFQVDNSKRCGEESSKECFRGTGINLVWET